MAGSPSVCCNGQRTLWSVVPVKTQPAQKDHLVSGGGSSTPVEVGPMRVRSDIQSAEILVFGADNGLRVRRTVKYRCARFTLRGVVDMATAPWLGDMLVEASVDPAVDVVVVDLAAVTFFGAAGLRCLNQAASRAA